MRFIPQFFIVLILVFFISLAEASGGWCFAIAQLEGCGFISEEYHRKTQDIISRLSVSTPEIIEELKKCPGETFYTPEHREQIKNLSQEKIEQATNECAEMLANAEEKLEPADERFSTPEKTWDLFIRSLKIGDKVTVIKCLSGRAKQNLEPFFENHEMTDLKKLGESFTGFQLMGDMGELQDAMVTRSNGQAGVVLFAKQGRNWKIGDM